MRKPVILVAMVAAAASSAAIAQKEGMTKDKFLVQAEKRFGKMDADSNGKLNQAEYLKWAQGRAAERGEAADSVKLKRIERQVAAADANSDGTVSLEEFKNAEAAKFDAKDANKNGTIDAGEAGGG